MNEQAIEDDGLPRFPDWVIAGHVALHSLFIVQEEWRDFMLRTDRQDIDIQFLTKLANRWNCYREVITLSEAERRWNKVNLRQYPLDRPFRWKSQDGRGTWLTTVESMRETFGEEPEKES